MRFRIAIFVLLSCLLAGPAMLHRIHVQNACAAMPDTDTCVSLAPTPAWMLPVELLSLAVLLYAVYLFVQAWRERHHEKVLLEEAGIHVREEDLPLEE